MADTHIKINAVTPRVQYVGDGSTTSFPYAFAIFDDSDMVVYVGDEIIETGYTVTGAGQTEGGNVVFDTAPENGVIITLLRNVPIERVTDFQEGGTFRPKNLNDEFDRQTAFAQQVQEALTRCVKVDPTSSTNPEDVIPKVEALYDDITNLDAVANDLTNIDTVATNISDVGTCATNMEDIQAAPGAATTASNAAIAAAASASSAAISAAGTHFKLFHHDWFDYELNDMAWLRADTFSWQDGTVYTEAYNHLVDDATNGTSQTETIAGHTITYTLADDGHKIVSDADASAVEGLYNDTGVAWYYILDLVNHRFKLPRELPITDKSKGNGNMIHLNNGTTDIGLQSMYGDGVRPNGSLYLPDAGNSQVSLTTDPTKSGIISHRANENGQQYLYFYVGQFTQTATEQTAGLNSELFNGKADVDLSNAAPNASASAKETIVGWGMPDYDSGVTTGYNTDYTPPCDGLGVWAFRGNYSKILIKKGNIKIAESTPDVNTQNSETSIILPLNGGETYTISFINTISEVILNNFYPYKGVQNA